MPETNDVISHLYYDLNDKIDSLEQRLAGAEDIYYSNSYVERLKALGSDVQYSTYPGGSISGTAFTDNTLYLTSIFIPKTSIISGIGYIISTQGSYTADEYNGIGLYSYDSTNEKLVLIASTTNDGDIWKAAANAYATKDFTTPITVNSGIYYVGLLYNNSAQVTAPILMVSAGQTTITPLINTIGLTTAKLVGGSVNTMNNLPSEILNTSITSVTIGAILYLY